MAGRQKAGQLVKLACERHLRDMENAEKREVPFRFDPDKAGRILRYFPAICRHSKGEWFGRPVHLQPWQKFRLASVFGWVMRETGFRRFRTSYHSLGRKNGKSTETAGVGCYLLASDDEPGAEVYSYATKLDQAKIIFNQSVQMVRASPALSGRFQIINNRILHLHSGSLYLPLSKDVQGMDGLNVHAGLCDELHAHRDGQAFHLVDQAMGSRRQPHHWIITTRGSNRITSICGEIDDLAEKVLKRMHTDERFFAYVACIDPQDAWDDPDCWIKANPNLGVSISMEDLVAQASKASLLPSARMEFKRKRCNLWTQSADGWVDEAAWLKCGDAWIPDEELKKFPCWVGLDLSATQDLTCLVALFDLGNGYTAVRCLFWMPRETVAERAIRDRVPYEAWVEDGWLALTEGRTMDYGKAAHDLIRFFSTYKVQGVAFDRWRIKDLLDELEKQGFEAQIARPDEDGRIDPSGSELPFVSWGQGFRDMSPSIDELERLIMEGNLLHGDNPLLTMCVANAMVAADPAGNRKFVKRLAIGRIDGAVALAMAAGLRTKLPQGWDRSVYEDRGLVTI